MKKLAFVCGATVLFAFLLSISFPDRAADEEVLKAAIESRAEATLVFGGDVMLSREIGALMERKNDYAFPFARIAALMRSADLAVVNLEGPISDRGINQGSVYSFRASPRAVETLQAGGVDVVSLANNHIYDYGPEALLDTLTRLRAARIGFAGAGENVAEAHAPHIAEVQGMRFAFLSYTNLASRALGGKNSAPAVALFDETAFAEDIRSAREYSDTVVVLFHFGDEYRKRHSAAQERMARAAVDAGAALVVGHHPHVPQDGEWYRGAYIAYSLGNLVFDQNFGETRRGLLLEAKFHDGALASVREIPIAFTADYQPYVVE